jgi:hypothetical protein
LNPQAENCNHLSSNNLQETPKDVLTKNCPKDNICPDLKQVISAWPELPEHIKTSIKTLIEAHITTLKGKSDVLKR